MGDYEWMPAPCYRGKWRRGKYRVVDGQRIVPVPGQDFGVYDPLEETAEQQVRKDAPSLIGDLEALDTADHAAIETFVNRWGLLGCFQHYMEWQLHVPTPEGGVRPDQSPRLIPTSALYESPAFRETRPAGHKGDPAAAGIVFDRRPPGPRGQVALAAYYGEFFPELTLQAREGGRPPVYPGVHSDALWQHLCEPIQWFGFEAGKFQKAARLMAEFQATGEPVKAGEGQWIIRQGIERVRQGMELEAGSWRLGIVCPSLISAAYLGLALELARGLGPRNCENESCGRLFQAGRPNQGHCSRECANTQGVREHRRRKREAMARGEQINKGTL